MKRCVKCGEGMVLVNKDGNTFTWECSSCGVKKVENKEKTLTLTGNLHR